MNHKGFINIILVSVIVVMLGAIGYLTLTRKSTPTVRPTPTPVQVPVTQQPASVPTTQSSETANRKVYRNDKYGFEVSYPPDWTLEPGSSTESVTLKKKSATWNYPSSADPIDALVRIDIIKNPKHLTLQGLFNEWHEECERSDTALGLGCPGPQDTTRWQQIQVGGAPALRSGKRFLPEGPEADSIYVNETEYYILLEGWYYNPNYDSDFTHVFNQIFSTLKFIR